MNLPQVCTCSPSWTPLPLPSLSFTISQSLLRLMFIELMMPSNHLILCRTPSPPTLNLSQFRVFFNESALLIRWRKYLSFSFSISLSNEYIGLIYFRIAWNDLSASQGTLKSLLQHHDLKASILLYSAYFVVQLSYQYMTTGKSHSFDYTDLCRQSNVSTF